jgi:hypothetical protein
MDYLEISTWSKRQAQMPIAITTPETANIWSHLDKAIPKSFLNVSSISFASFALGNGSSGTGQFKILHSGSHPSLTLKKKSLSGGTTLRT